ncbi:lengsin-like [Strongylocentrotus purpuratus]|uniref:Lengsin n=1 Tax=Strongylocentrotus purpuratus TaxID=7668 RepID=A0A7M7HKY6_STRPU|nr:lengsin-like [Strongylocentrotus purpuratus]
MEKILKSLKENGIKTVRFEQSQTYGIPHNRAIPVKHFENMATHGVNMCLTYMALDPKGMPIQNTGYGGEVHYADCKAFPDLDTFQILPWCTSTARVLIEGEYNGQKVPVYPRVVAKQQLERLKELDLSIWSAHEHEFYLVNKETLEPMDSETFVLATICSSVYDSFFQQVISDLPQAGVDIECYGCEAGEGQLEITYRPEFGIKAADTAHTFKLGIKEIALQHGYIASFMSKPWPDIFGSSAHYCHSLWDADGKIPKLYDASSSTGLSEIGQYWVAGLIAHARAITVLMAPTTNCLKRFQQNSAAPWNATWGPDNRTCAIRVKADGETSTYIENRIGASACNPYISMAATIAAGLDGIIKKLPLPEGIDGEGDAYNDEHVPEGTQKLPETMEEAVEALLEDKVITEALGPEFIKCFVAAKRHDIQLEKEAIAKGKCEEWERKYLFYMM